LLYRTAFLGARAIASEYLAKEAVLDD
jgi:hypothetical protein